MGANWAPVVQSDMLDHIHLKQAQSRKLDLRSNGLALPVMILGVTDGIESVGLAGQPDLEESQVISWQERLDSMVTDLDEAIASLVKPPLPLTYRGHTVEKHG